MQKFEVRRLCELINAGTQPLQNLGVLQEVEKRFGKEHRNPWGQWALTKGLTAFEKTVAGTKGKYCVGDSVTLADTFLPSAVDKARLFAVDMEQFPHIVAIMSELNKLPEFIACQPEQ